MGSSDKAVVTNKKARRDYEIIYTFEAGIILEGCEVKSLRRADANLSDSFARVENNGVFLFNLHISPYKFSADSSYKPKRKRKLLLHKNQILRLSQDLKTKGLTLIPLRIYFKNNKWAKLEIGMAKGKKIYDKREDMKKRIIDREIAHYLKRAR